jgi:hypothetical protein
MIIRRLLVTAFALAAINGTAHAHEAWAEPDGDGGFLIAWGHPGELPGRYDTSLVTYAALLGGTGQPVAFERFEAGDQVRLRPAQPDTAVLAARFVYEPGPTIQTSEGRYTRGSKADHPGYRRAFYSVRSGTTLTGWSAELAQPAGFELEIVPLTNPFDAAQSLHVRILHNGSAREGADIVLTDSTGEMIVRQSDARGEAVLETPSSGRYSLSARLELVLDDDSDVDTRQLDTNLHIVRANGAAQ